MNALFALFAALASVFAPTAALVPDHDVSVQAPLVSASLEQASATQARFVFEVDHTGVETPALLTLEGDSVAWVHAVTLQPGRNVLVDDDFPIGEYAITLQNVLTAGSDNVDLADCAGTTVARMATTMTLTTFAMSVGMGECVPPEA